MNFCTNDLQMWIGQKQQFSRFMECANARYVKAECEIVFRSIMSVGATSYSDLI